MQPENFIILSDSRSGSTLVVSLLNSHGQVRCEGEVFHQNEPKKIFWRAARPGETTAEELALRDSDPGAFLEKYVFSQESADELATGFKLFYHHASLPQWLPVWDFLEARKSLKVIHLIRENQLERILSNKIAMTTNKWFSLKSEGADAPPVVTLDEKTCYQEFQASATKQAKFRSQFSGHPMLEIAYEDLVADREASNSRILEFLGVENRPMFTGLKKQNTRKLSDAIGNFAELKKHFAGTKWAKYFEEN
ncbi:MAG: sulfotransferase [Planctomycetota bacterium]|jgi:LPS sulfotransferase NodH